MGDIVSDGTMFACDKGGIVTLSVSASSTTGDGKKLATKSNFSLSGVGFCAILQGPCAVAMASVSEAQSPGEIDGVKALGSGCSIDCAQGGKMQVMANCQSKVHHN